MSRWVAYLIVFGILGVYIAALALVPKVVAIATAGAVVLGLGVLAAEVLVETID